MIIDTPEGIRHFQLCAARGAVKLEKLGMRHSRGSVKARWAKHYGLSNRAPHDAVIARINEEITTLAAVPSA